MTVSAHCVAASEYVFTWASEEAMGFLVETVARGYGVLGCHRVIKLIKNDFISSRLPDDTPS